MHNLDKNKLNKKKCKFQLEINKFNVMIDIKQISYIYQNS